MPFFELYQPVSQIKCLTLHVFMQYSFVSNIQLIIINFKIYYGVQFQRNRAKMARKVAKGRHL
jgi:hypothetical protein